MTRSSDGRRFSNVAPSCDGVSASSSQCGTKLGYDTARSRGDPVPRARAGDVVPGAKDRARDRRTVEAVIGEHVGVRAAGGNLLQTDLRQLGANAGARQRRADHHALAELEVVIVQRDDVLEGTEGLTHPLIVDAVEPRQVDHRGRDALARQFVGRAPRVGEQDGSVANQRHVVPLAQRHAAADLEARSRPASSTAGRAAR